MLTEGENIQLLIDGCRKENRKSQEQLYRSYYRAMMNLCLRYTKNEKDSLEALNNGFYKVFKNIHRFDGSKASLYTWIRTIILHSCLDMVKSNKNAWRIIELEQAANVDEQPAAISGMSATEILNLVRSLPPATQIVFNLYVIEGYNHNEIATLLNISPSTSKWHLSEARKKLQEMINKENNK